MAVLAVALYGVALFALAVPLHDTDSALRTFLSWITLAGAGAAVASLFSDVVKERGGSLVTRIARAFLNAVMALGVALVLLRGVELTTAELVVLATVLGSLGREYSLDLLAQIVGRWMRPR